MVKFEKNGQGYFEFDSVELIKLTDLAFTIFVERQLNNKYVLKIEQIINDDYFMLMIYKTFEVVEVLYSFEIKEYWKNTYNVNSMKEYLAFYESGELNV